MSEAGSTASLAAVAEQGPVDQGDPLAILSCVELPDRDDDMLRAALVAAVHRTLTDRSPLIGLSVSSRIAEIDDEYGEYVEESFEESFEDRVDELSDVDPFDETPAENARLILIGWLRAARRPDDDGDLARQVVAWVAAEIGRSDPSVEHQAIHLGGSGAPQPLDADALLSSDLTAVLVWLVSGLVAVAGHGDALWLNRSVGEAS